MAWPPRDYGPVAGVILVKLFHPISLIFFKFYKLNNGAGKKALISEEAQGSGKGYRYFNFNTVLKIVHYRCIRVCRPLNVECNFNTIWCEIYSCWKHLLNLVSDFLKL